MGWVEIAFGGIGLVATALLSAAALRAQSALTFALAAYLLASAELVLLGEALSLVHSVSAGTYLLGEAIFLGLAFGAWQLRGRPRPPLPRVAGLRRQPLVIALGAVVACALGYELFLVLATPPDNWDSMTYHLARAVWWLQRGGFHYLPHPHTQRENAYQPNSELEILWTFALLHRDTFAAAFQLAGEVASLVGVYGIARRTGFGRPASAFAALLAATLTEIALESVTTQNDLLAASFVVVAACLLLGGTRSELALAGLAVGLSLGTKLTSAFALPLLLALAFVTLRRRQVVEACAFCIGAFALVGVYGYAVNLANTGHVLGPPAASEAFRPTRITLGGTASTVARIGFRFIDLPGFHMKTSVIDAIDRAGQHTFMVLRIPQNPPESTYVPFDFAVGQVPNEDVSFFGPLGFLLVLPLSVGGIVAGVLRRTSPARLVLALSVPVYMVEIALTYKYDIWLGRFMIAPVLLAMPLAAWLYRSRFLAGAAALVGATTLVLAHAYNAAKPTGLGGTTPVWTLPRAEAQTVERGQMLPVVQTIDRMIPPAGRLGTVLGVDDWEYPLFGPHLRRRLVPLPDGPATLVAAERLGLDAIVVAGGMRQPPASPDWSRARIGTSGWLLLTRS